MKWTDKQEQTIKTRDKNILVSAAAGSGKTAVLIERIKQLILDESHPVDVDRFLITTFTNAAAAEMKSRMEGAIRSALAEEGLSKERRDNLRRQLRLIPKANISTFHSFTIEVMKRYFYLTDLEPGVKIGDETQMEILKRETIDELFDKRFVEDYDNFTAWLTKYSSYKNERDIKASILSIYNEMRSVPDYMDWATESTQQLHEDSPLEALQLDKFVAQQTESVINEACATYDKGIEALREQDLQRLVDLAEQNLVALGKVEEWYKISGQWPTMTDLKLNQMRANKEEKPAYEMVKDTVKKYMDSAKAMINDLGKKFYALPMSECEAELKALAPDMDYLVDLLKEFEETYRSKKAEMVVVDFDDVMHYAIQILRDETVQNEYREKFEYIFVDEYQDSNQLQETIVGLIARDDNLFMVGDVKQSIYKFRQAEPELFMARYDRYANDDQDKSIKIDLNDNFRSKRSVTSTVNAIFDKIMDGYDDNAALHCNFGDEYPGMKTIMRVINKASYDDKEEMSEAEFREIAKQIRSHVGLEIYDAKSDAVRKTTYSDITVLCRGNSMLEQLERYLNNEGIPAFGQASGGYFDTIEVQVFLNLLQVINNTRQDIPLISAMRSVAFDFSPSQLARIRIQFREGSYYTAVKNYAETGDDLDLRSKCQSMFDTINYWKQLSKAVSLEELVRYVMDTTGYFDYCSGLPVGKQRTSNLRLLIEKAAEFESNNYSGLHGFLGYVDAMREREIKVAEAKVLDDGSNVVNIMTIHKSKGLEFPIVILAGMGKELRMTGKGGIISMHKEFSLALPNVNREEAWTRKTLLQKAINARKKQEYIEEEIRVLYVALTRAKDRLVLIGSVKDAENLSSDVPTMSSYLNMVYPILCDTADTAIIEANDLEEALAGEGYIEEEIRELNRVEYSDIIELARTSRDEEAIALIDERLGYVYPHEDKGIKSKYSVSSLNHMGEDEHQPVTLSKNLFSTEKRQLNAAEIGTAMHAVMERMDFRRALDEGESYVRAKADEMRECGQLSPEERDALNIENLTAFFATDVGKRAAMSNELHKEREFILLEEIEGTETIVQGIIDCYFIEEDGIVLIDYKNSYLGGDTTEEVIRERYETQIMLYKKALEEATGLAVKESYLYLFNLQNFTQIT